MSSERIIGEFYAALPLGSGGKPHNAKRDCIDDALQLHNAMGHVGRRPRRKSRAKTLWPVLTARGREHSLVGDFEGRTVLRPGLAMIVNPGRGDVGVTQPLLDLGDVGLVVKRVGRGGRPQRVRPDRKT